MLKFKYIIFTFAFIHLSLFGIIGNNSANEIISMYPSYGGYYDYTGYLYHGAYVETDVPFYDINWYINGVHAGWSDGSNIRTEGYFYPTTSDYPGSPLGKDYEIKAVVGWLADNGDADYRSRSYNVVVYTTPDVDEGIRMNTGAYGKASADAGWNEHTGEATAYGNIYNGTGRDVAYAIRIHYAVGEAQANGALKDDGLFDAPNVPQIIDGRIEDNHPSQSRNLSYSDSFEITFFDEGDRFVVETAVTITAWDPEFKKTDSNTDVWFASESVLWIISDQE